MTATAFAEHRGLLYAVAYRVLGSVADAEDVVQETWLRWSRVDTATVEDPDAYLVKSPLACLSTACAATEASARQSPGRRHLTDSPSINLARTPHQTRHQWKRVIASGLWPFVTPVEFSHDSGSALISCGPLVRQTLLTAVETRRCRAQWAGGWRAGSVF